MSETTLAETAARALALVDLTNLNDDCTAEDVSSLCARAVTRHGHVAAICIWPRFVALGVEKLKGTGVKVATVVNFPAGGTDTDAVVRETEAAIADGADEIDLVMSYKAFLAGNKDQASDQIARVKAVIPAPAQLKVILETGEIKDPLLIHAASDLAIQAGADFIKTSTGKVKVNATLEAAEIMLTVIEENRRDHGREIGFKPAGGIRTADDAADYLALADKIMGANWASSATLRFGASGLLDALVNAIEGKAATAAQGY